MFKVTQKKREIFFFFFFCPTEDSIGLVSACAKLTKCCELGINEALKQFIEISKVTETDKKLGHLLFSYLISVVIINVKNCYTFHC